MPSKHVSSMRTWQPSTKTVVRFIQAVLSKGKGTIMKAQELWFSLII